MIWHFFEVWVALLAAFIVGCTMGVVLYEILARTTYATEQGMVADQVAEVVDRVKDRLGVGPVWRPRRRRTVEPTLTGPIEPSARGVSAVAEAAAAGDVIVGWEDESAEQAAPRIATSEAPPSAAEPIDARDVAVEPPAPTERAALPPPEPEAPQPAIEEEIVPKRPAALAEPRNGVPDNLQRIRGIGERNEVRLNKLGIFHFGQIAAWTPAEMRWVAQQLAFPERVERDDWVGQAIILASGGDTGFTKAADRRRARREEERSQVWPDDD